MAAKSYRYYIIDDFPEITVGQEIKTIHQKTLWLSEQDDAPSTSVGAVGLDDSRTFSKYAVKHETYQKIRGRYLNKPIAHYISCHDFHLYCHPQLSIMFVEAPKNLAVEMVARLSQANNPFSFGVQESKIDLVKLGADLKDKIRGGWFGNLRIADVSTIGLFGLTVGMSQTWGEYEQMGELKSVDVEFEVSDRGTQLVKIGSTRAIVLYSNFSEAEALPFVLEMQRTFDAYVID